ncbi:hypothetical protein [Photobacterium leiognathi]|uniref:hypothetical protein n=1 Tax=Photobacterium leiognathi TaxID=553611 RepID=UPI0034E93C69
MRRFTPEDLAQITFWMFGSLERASYSNVLTVSLVIIICSFFTIPLSMVSHRLKTRRCKSRS